MCRQEWYWLMGKEPAPQDSELAGSGILSQLLANLLQPSLLPTGLALAPWPRPGSAFSAIFPGWLTGWKATAASFSVMLTLCAEPHTRALIRIQAWSGAWASGSQVPVEEGISRSRTDKEISPIRPGRPQPRTTREGNE